MTHTEIFLVRAVLFCIAMIMAVLLAGALIGSIGGEHKGLFSFLAMIWTILYLPKFFVWAGRQIRRRVRR